MSEPNPARLLLLSPTTTYRVEDFLKAVDLLNTPVTLIVASEKRSAMEHASAGGLVRVALNQPDKALAQIDALHAEAPLDAIVSVDQGAAWLAAEAARRLGLRGHNPEAVTLASSKALTRRRFAERGVPGPSFFSVDRDEDPRALCARVTEESGWPCVLKPLGLSGSRGVIRADDPDAFVAAFERVSSLLKSLDDDHPDLHQSILVESFMPGGEVAVEAMMVSGDLEVLAIFDKPDPLDGPFFEETLYITPSRLPHETQREVGEAVAQAAWALGLDDGPVHAEVRLTPEGPRVLEVAARSIGGLCARTLQFATGLSLETIILAHALGLDPPLERERQAAGVMMIPIPRAGFLREVRVADAREVPGVEDVVITHPRARLTPLPEGASYLGFIFARAQTPGAVELALREAHQRLEILIDDEALSVREHD